MWLRLAIALALCVLAVRMVSYVMLTIVIRDRVEAIYGGELERQAISLQRLARFDAAGRPMIADSYTDQRYDSPGSGYYWQVRGAGGTSLRSPSLAGQNLPMLPKSLRAKGARTVMGATGLIFIRQRPVPGIAGAPDASISVAMDRRLVDAEVSSLINVRAVLSGFMSILLIPLSMFAIWYAASPLLRLRKEIEALGAGQSDQIAGRFSPDIQPLAEALNNTLASHRSLAHHFSFQAAALAHNVRGAMVSIIGEMEQLERKQGSSPHLDAMQNACRIILRQIEAHVRRADLPGSDASMPPETTDLEATLEEVLEAVQGLYRKRRLDWELGVGPACRLRCRQNDLGEILFSLLDNAGKWATGTVGCNWRIEEANAVVEIDDDGPGIGTDNLAQPATGMGLGLEIAQELARLHGGSVTLGASPTGGARATVIMPLATPRFSLSA